MYKVKKKEKEEEEDGKKKKMKGKKQRELEGGEKRLLDIYSCIVDGEKLKRKLSYI